MKKCNGRNIPHIKPAYNGELESWKKSKWSQLGMKKDNLPFTNQKKIADLWERKIAENVWKI